jgi:hypothetical protein
MNRTAAYIKREKKSLETRRKSSLNSVLEILRPGMRGTFSIFGSVSIDGGASRT